MSKTIYLTIDPGPTGGYTLKEGSGWTQQMDVRDTVFFVNYDAESFYQAVERRIAEYREGGFLVELRDNAKR